MLVFWKQYLISLLPPRMSKERRNDCLFVCFSLSHSCFLSAVIKVDGNSYWTTALMDNAPVATFLWTTTFPLKIYWPLILPSIIAYIITAVESMGDITATEEASEILPEGPEHDKRIQGGILGDAVNSLFSVLGMITPNTTFSQNNGVISLTRCASRSAGYACGFLLILAGIFAKVGAFFVSIPNCVLGGMTTYVYISTTKFEIFKVPNVSRYLSGF